MTFREILLDFLPRAIDRFDCELARFSGGLRVKHVSKKGKKTKKHRSTYCHFRESGNPWPDLSYATTMLGKLRGRTMDSRFRGNDKKGLEKAAAVLLRKQERCLATMRSISGTPAFAGALKLSIQSYILTLWSPLDCRYFCKQLSTCTVF